MGKRAAQNNADHKQEREQDLAGRNLVSFDNFFKVGIVVASHNKLKTN